MFISDDEGRLKRSTIATIGPAERADPIMPLRLGGKVPLMGTATVPRVAVTFHEEFGYSHVFGKWEAAVLYDSCSKAKRGRLSQKYSGAECIPVPNIT